ncbi:hypothetical protein PR048_015826 [Dryococelus australis]|uniref:Uncharacterized protein n=1 Tax=Dryococelus australis TaxID=614101 RepID=A0ABQ9HI74_9NEOP|nr:hypothetical protein PR048_015826 [Dryococelus australis]
MYSGPTYTKSTGQNRAGKTKPTNSGQPITAYCLMPEAARWIYGLAVNCWPTVSGLRWLDVVMMPGLRRLDVATMPDLRRLDVITMPGKPERYITAICDNTAALAWPMFSCVRTDFTQPPGLLSATDATRCCCVPTSTRAAGCHSMNYEKRGIGGAARLYKLGHQSVGHLNSSPHSGTLTAQGAAAAGRLRAPALRDDDARADDPPRGDPERPSPLEKRMPGTKTKWPGSKSIQQFSYQIRSEKNVHCIIIRVVPGISSETPSSVERHSQEHPGEHHPKRNNLRKYCHHQQERAPSLLYQELESPSGASQPASSRSSLSSTTLVPCPLSLGFSDTKSSHNDDQTIEAYDLLSPKPSTCCPAETHKPITHSMLNYTSGHSPPDPALSILITTQHTIQLFMPLFLREEASYYLFLPQPDKRLIISLMLPVFFWISTGFLVDRIFPVDQKIYFKSRQGTRRLLLTSAAKWYSSRSCDLHADFILSMNSMIWGQLQLLHSSKFLPKLSTCAHDCKNSFKCKSLTIQDVRRFHQAFYKTSDKIEQDGFILMHTRS